MVTSRLDTNFTDAFIENLALGLAIALIFLWVTSLAWVLLVPVVWWQMPVWVVVRTFLHTGLFILAHDAMHENLVRRSPQLNHGLGRFTVGLYAGLSYHHCRQHHRKHHQHPAQIGDPDFHDGLHTHPIAWYCYFMRNYFLIKQFLIFLLGVIGVAIALNLWWDVPFERGFIFYLLPLLLSSIQLFIFGTYFPHGQGRMVTLPTSCPRSLQYLWSLVSCYHFGVYHHEHHQAPRQPWFLLPHLPLLNNIVIKA
ncbi:fatty acid desaturase [[Limnothrix rosea] IAM M-220]|uniref:fatty acid desaturase n=1 Tax=[Limnothrix rosea] IAM M-220 TaxID=454133 RepID=UPI0009664EEE|nr:fatty acid desaturase [[Limnothrix rosea] IAM M-220]OKH13162.1 hypothetical protein NIES208_15410 [[Limnothrix rosea] IAM M-220]